MSLRVLIAVTHLLGAGHFTRAAALARAFADAGHGTTLMTGGSSVPFAQSEKLRLVQLPPVRTIGTDFKTLLDATGRPVNDAYLAARRKLLLETLEATRPDILITELFPFGRRVLADEFTALLDKARSMRQRPLILSSVRDILVAPKQPERIAQAHERLARLYDAILVHSDPELAALDASWPVDEGLRPLIHYTGYIDEHPASIPEQPRSGIVVSGGSSAASLPLYRAAIEAAHEITDKDWRILIGRGVDDAEFETLRNDAPSHVAIERARPDFRTLLGQAELSVSQAGYNTSVDLLRTGVRAVLVPFEAGHETEQRRRAERLKALRIADIVAEPELSGRTLAQAVRAGLAQPRPSPPALSLDGARQSVAIVERLVAAAPAIHRTIDWSPLDRALERAQDAGWTPEFWWRDDDAVADTPQLDRLLRMAGTRRAGIGLAIIPQGIEPSLVQRFAGEALAFALVHGWSHANHATAREKKAEFGAHRPASDMAKETAQGLQRLRALLGPRALPVFVPPWNRIAPDLVTALPHIGYAALSTFKDRSARCPAPGLMQINAHIDPIDWHGTRSLADPAFLVRSLADAVERRIDGVSDREEPIGYLTHHLIHDEKVWTFSENLLVYLSRRQIPFASIEMLFRDENGIVAAL